MAASRAIDHKKRIVLADGNGAGSCPFGCGVPGPGTPRATWPVQSMWAPKVDTCVIGGDALVQINPHVVTHVNRARRSAGTGAGSRRKNRGNEILRKTCTDDSSGGGRIQDVCSPGLSPVRGISS